MPAKNKKRSKAEAELDDSTHREPSRFEHEKQEVKKSKELQSKSLI